MKHSCIKAILTILFLTVVVNFSQAQTDSLTYSTEQNQDSTVKYLTPMEYAFMLHEDPNWLLKVNLIVATEGYTGGFLKVSFEKRIANGFSLDAMVSMSNVSTFFKNDDRGYNYGLEGALEARWYYKTLKNIRNGKASTSLSGAYFAGGAAYHINMHETNPADNISFPDIFSVFAAWGMQHRFLKYGYLDFGIKGGYNNAIGDRGISYGFLATYVNAGLAFTRDKQKLDYEKLCPVLRCQAADRFLLKTNIANIVSITAIRKSIISSITPNISAELKIGSSPFSINTKLSSRIEYLIARAYDYSAYIFSPVALLEGRYYYNLNMRILMGKTGNGLSANYVSLGTIYQGEYQILKSNGYRSDLSKSFGGILLSTGLQRVVSDHLYYDFNIGLGYGAEFEYDGIEGTKKWNNKSIFNLGVAIGYRF
ncbi:MAG: hypothetical protein K9H16_10410 [Bacteroidales bacterium]|nr:hypothetical protein [Bacteroidales bacterium]